GVRVRAIDADFVGGRSPAYRLRTDFAGRRGDAFGHVQIAARDTADVVGGQRELSRPASERDIRMMTGPFGDISGIVNQLKRTDDISSGEPGIQRRPDVDERIAGERALGFP